MELVIEKQSMLTQSECADYVVPDGMWARFKFEGCYPDGKGTISKGGVIKGQLSMNITDLIVRESGTYEACVTGRNTKSSIYVELIHEAERGTIIVAPGRNVTVDKTVDNTTTTYTVHAKDDDSKTVIRGGENITVSSTKSGDTTTWTINGESGGSHTEVRGGSNITVQSRTEGNRTIYTVNGTEQGSHTEVRAGTNTTVQSSTEGNKTIYTVNATGGGGGGEDVELESTDPNLIITQV